MVEAPKTESVEPEPASTPQAPDALQQPPPPLSLRVKPPGARGLNKPAIIALVGGAVSLILVLAASGLNARPSGPATESRALMSAPARPEMAQGRVGQLPQSYEEAAAFARARGREDDIPELGAPMAGDIAAFAPDGYEQSYDPEGGDDAAPYRPTMPNDSGQASEADEARRSGLFFAMREQAPDAGVRAAASEPGAERVEEADRGQMSSSHRLTAPVSRRSLHPGTIIPASLITAVNSEAPGAVIAQVTQGVYDSASGDHLLIPQGARLIGSYRSASRYGQSRIAIQWARLVMPDGRQIILGEAGIDAGGAAGVEGDIDNHWDEVFGAAALGTLINVAAAATEERNQVGLVSGGVGIIAAEDPAAEAARDGVQRAASQVTARVVDRGLSIPPTVRLAAGARISAMATREIVLQAQ